MKDFSSDIQEWMSRESLSFEQAAERLCVSSIIVRLWVNGKRCPSLKNQRTLERVLGISSNLHLRCDKIEARLKKLEEETK